MRSAELRCAVLALLMLGGCAQVKQAVQQVAAPVPAASAPAASASAPATAPAPVKVAAAPVDPATQRAFDDALNLLKAGRAEQAQQAFSAMVQQSPELPGPHANLGLIHRQAGRAAEAVAELEQAVKLGPGEAVYWNQLGLAYRAQGQFGKSREAYEKAIALQPQYAAPVLNLGILQDLYLGDAAQALALYTRYLALSPQGDPAVAKWVAEVRNRKPSTAPQTALSRKEQP